MAARMVSMVNDSVDDVISSVFASKYVRDPLPSFEIPEKSMPKEEVYEMIKGELSLDRNPRLNLASFGTTWMEPECEKLIMDSLNKDFADMSEYPVTAELQSRCVNMIARLFNAPLGGSDPGVGVGTVGSSEAAILAGLALKKMWQKKGQADRSRNYKPANIIVGANAQVWWKKFAEYCDVELKEVKLKKDGCFVMDPVEAVNMVNENTICVVVTLGSIFNGEFDNIQEIHNLLGQKNAQTKWNTPIHVDAASGGFVAPFLYPDLVWDFRLPLVKSINVSGHDYGLVYPGVGWVIWRSEDYLPEELIFRINYLGAADQTTLSLNFSKGSSQIIAQYYQLVRLGKMGYQNVMLNCHENMKIIKDGLENLKRFNIVSTSTGLPLVAFSLINNEHYDEFVVSTTLRQAGWIVPAYTMPPNNQNVTVLRVIIREDMSRTLALRLLADIKRALKVLDGNA